MGLTQLLKVVQRDSPPAVPLGILPGFPQIPNFPKFPQLHNFLKFPQIYILSFLPSDSKVVHLNSIVDVECPSTLDFEMPFKCQVLSVLSFSIFDNPLNFNLLNVL